MASMNLLGFSLSPQEQHNTHHHQTHFGLFNPTTTTTEDDVTTHHHNNHGNCFDLTTPTLNNLPPFPIYEEQQSFNSNHLSSSSHQQDWKDQNLLLGTSCNNNHHHQQPKLENFLGGHSFTDHHQDGDYIFQNCSSTGGDGGGSGSGGGSTNSIGLSMIKTWLRNQPLHHNHSSENNKETMVATSDNNTATAPTTTTNSVQTLSLSMSTGHGSLLPPTNTVSVAAAGAGGGGGGDSYSSSEINSSNNNKQVVVVENGGGIVENNNNGAKKSIDTFGQRTSIYRGVTRHRWTGRYEAHLWDNSCRREGQTRKGRQVYLGGYDKEEKAARAYDLAALKYWGTTTTTNFPISQYEKELEEMKHMTRQEYVASLRRKSSGFSRGASIYRGVTRHHQHGRWQARIGRVAGNKDLYLGTFSTQEEAAEAYDIAAIKFRGLSAVTNFDMSRYDVKSILESSTLPIGGAAKRLKDMDNHNNVDLITNVDNVHQRQQLQLEDHSNISINSHHHSLTDGINNFHGWPATLAFQQHYTANYGSSSSSSQRLWCKQEQDSSDHNNFHQEIHPLQLGGGGTHNFFQHGIMSMDHSASMDNNNSSGSSSVVYGGGDGNGYVFPVGSVIGNDSSNEIKGLGYDSTVFGSEAYNQTHGRHLYYQQQSSTMEHNNNNNGVVVVKGSPYDHYHHQHHGGSNNWVPTAIPTIAASRSLCHGAPPFTLLHE